ncbi:MAG: hypothetical protein ABIH99_02815 [Candidatus Micrarchaeota archaeon]
MVTRKAKVGSTAGRKELEILEKKIEREKLDENPLDKIDQTAQKLAFEQNSRREIPQKDIEESMNIKFVGFEITPSTLKESFSDFALPAVVGGIVSGLLMGLPLVNLFFPSVLLGGCIAVFLVKAESREEGMVSAKDGLKVGFMSGVIAIAVSLLLLFAIATFYSRQLFLTILPKLVRIGVSSEHAEWLLKAAGIGPNLSETAFKIRFILSVLLLPLLGALGGGLAAKYTKYVRKGLL